MLVINLPARLRALPFSLVDVARNARDSLRDALRVGAFSHLDNARLVDHHWAAESAYKRALGTGQARVADEMATLVRGLRREMRRRGLR